MAEIFGIIIYIVIGIFVTVFLLNSFDFEVNHGDTKGILPLVFLWPFALIVFGAIAISNITVSIIHWTRR